MSGNILLSLWIFTILLTVSAVQRKGQRVISSPDIPETDFSCQGRPPGYYADVQTGCQVYHMCGERSQQFSYKCPNTTLFQQRMLICAHWYQVNCTRSESYFGANLLIGQRDKPFVNEHENTFYINGKQVSNLRNPEILQDLNPPEPNPSDRKAKSQRGNDHNNFEKFNLKRSDTESGNLGTTQREQRVAQNVPTLSTVQPTGQPEFTQNFPVIGLRNENGASESQNSNRGSVHFNPAPPNPASSVANSPTVSNPVPNFTANGQSFREQNVDSQEHLNGQRFNGPSGVQIPFNAQGGIAQNTPPSQNDGQRFNEQNINVQFNNPDAPNLGPDQSIRNSFNGPNVPLVLNNQRPNVPNSPQPENNQRFVGQNVPQNQFNGQSSGLNIPKSQLQSQIENQQAQLNSQKFNVVPFQFNGQNLNVPTVQQGQFNGQNVPSQGQFNGQNVSPQDQINGQKSNVPNVQQGQFNGQNLNAPQLNKFSTSFQPFLTTNSQVIDKQTSTQPQKETTTQVLDTVTTKSENGAETHQGGFSNFPTSSTPENAPVTPEVDFQPPEEPTTQHPDLPDDEYNVFINRFNPYEETVTTTAGPESIEYYTFIDRFNPYEDKPEGIPNDKEFKPKEGNVIKIPPFQVEPPFQDSEESESNHIELHFQDPRSKFFIPDSGVAGPEDIPIVVTIPLHSAEDTPRMWFKSDKSNDPCGRCHPSFVVNKKNCMPCVIIR